MKQPVLHDILPIVRKAGEIILRRDGATAVRTKAAQDFVTEVDFRVQSFIRDALAENWPDIQFMGEEQVSASHILVDSEDKANELLAKINAGEITFEDAARENSSCPSSQRGGSLGEFGRGQMVPEFDSACFEMEVGEVRGPVQTQFGYHLIRLDAKKAAEPMHFGDVREMLVRQLTMEKQQAAYRSKINQLKILYPVER